MWQLETMPPAHLARLPARFSLETATPAARVYQDLANELLVGRLSLDAQGAQASGPSSDNAGHNSS